jgi:hypothetical protein
MKMTDKKRREETAGNKNRCNKKEEEKEKHAILAKGKETKWGKEKR